MSKEKDEPAFPVDSAAEHQYCGMTLRDYFAAKAMQGICSHIETWGLVTDQIATSAYELADAMLAARAQS